VGEGHHAHEVQRSRWITGSSVSEVAYGTAQTIMPEPRRRPIDFMMNLVVSHRNSFDITA